MLVRRQAGAKMERGATDPAEVSTAQAGGHRRRQGAGRRGAVYGRAAAAVAGKKIATARAEQRRGEGGQAAAETSVETEEMVFRICEAIW